MTAVDVSALAMATVVTAVSHITAGGRSVSRHVKTLLIYKAQPVPRSKHTPSLL